ncbi:hypothetical protein [Nocardioides immobilis]|uniref:hypothetical protein n=1 Tax=Nocardioides immobilis TaxID=2049295 RepID=UPI001C71461A|nr:hypothetical protein [Nocardioides immobilis]
MQYVRGNFWAGETFTSLEEAQARAEAWCAERAGMRTHGITQRRPAEAFAELEAGCLLPVPEPYDQPVFTWVKVHREYHLEVAKRCNRSRALSGPAPGRPRRQRAGQAVHERTRRRAPGEDPPAAAGRWPVHRP